MREKLPAESADRFPGLTTEITEAQRDELLATGKFTKKIDNSFDFVSPGDEVTLKLPDNSKLVGVLISSEPSEDPDCVRNTYRLAKPSG